MKLLRGEFLIFCLDNLLLTIYLFSNSLCTAQEYAKELEKKLEASEESRKDVEAMVGSIAWSPYVEPFR
jgi:hypothetical protein